MSQLRIQPFCPHLMATSLLHRQPCLRYFSRHGGHCLYRHYSMKEEPVESKDTGNLAQDASTKVENDPQTSPGHNKAVKEPGAMSRRLQEATEDTLFMGGRAGRRAIEDAGFSEELKEKLLSKIEAAKFQEQVSSSSATLADTLAMNGQGTRTHATGNPWTGDESTHDLVRRMLEDSRKPLDPKLRGKFVAPPVDLRLRRESAVSHGQRVASAREKANNYTSLGIGAGSASGKGSNNGKGLTEEEKAEMREEFRDRFRPGFGGVNPLTGLEALANKRIEDAIARGQFKNIPRGKDVELDTRANNPFVDTTEYFLNKMIQRQEILPPWIEKQQDLAKAAHTFRTRLRNDWKRHASRMIASKGGSLSDKIHRANLYAKSEALHNPRRHHSEQVNVSASHTDDPVMVKMRQIVDVQGTEQAAAATGLVVPSAFETAETDAAAKSRQNIQLPPPFRDRDWEKVEEAYLKLSIGNLNSITRLYNLMAPDLAKKPYFSLERELDSAFADVAPLLAGEIQERATRPSSLETDKPFGDKKEGILSFLGKTNTSPRVHESKAKAYGLKEWWRDIRGKI